MEILTDEKTEDTPDILKFSSHGKTTAKIAGVSKGLQSQGKTQGGQENGGNGAVKEAKVEKYTPKEQILNATDKQFIASAELLFDKAKNKVDLDKKDFDVVYGKVDKGEAAKLKAKTGLNLEGYEYELTLSDIRHIYKRHGNEKLENEIGQIAVQASDIALIPEIVRNYDDVRLSSKKSGDGRNVLIYTKVIGNKYYYFESVGAKEEKVLQPKTMYIKK